MRIILLLFIGIFSLGFEISATYKANYGWFGTIATASGSFKKFNSHYLITTISKTTGFAKKFVNLTQIYQSSGVIKNNILIPLEYKNIIIRNGKQYTLIYSFDYNNSKIYKTKYKDGKFIYKKPLCFFAKNDILTLYWNLPKIMHSNSQTFKALGGERHTGRVDVTILKKSKSITKLKVNLYNKVFAGDKGILFLDVNNSNWVTIKGVVKNVLKVGDVKGEITSLRVLP
jgi:hypothetical protein